MIKLRRILLLNSIYRVLFILCLAYSILVTLAIKYKSVYDIETNEFACKVKDKKYDKDKLSLELKCKENVVATYYIKTLDELKYLKENIKFGSSLLIKGRLEEPINNTIPNGFNYKKYLYNKKVYYILNIDSIKIIKESNNVFYKLKNYMYERSDKFTNSSYIYSFILGKTTLINSEVLDNYRTCGVSHLFALSGQHVSIFSLILLTLLKKLKISEILRYIVVFMFLILFSFICGFSPSILRSTLLFFLLGLNKVFYLNIKTVNILFVVFSILVIINPFIIYNLSFVLSFTIAFFLIIGSDYLKSKNYFISLFKVSLLSSISSLILCVYYFGYFNILSCIYNLFFVPYVSFIVFPLTLITFVIPILYPILNITTNVMELIISLFSKINVVMYFPKINIQVVILFEVLVYLFIKFRKKSLLCILALILIIIKIKPYFSSDTSIYFLDVGQGDSTLIVSKNLKETVLIDTGGKISYNKEEWKKNKTVSIAKDKLIPFFRSIGVNKINYLVLTHGDFDHMKESFDLVENFKVQSVIFNCGEFNSLEGDLIKVLNSKNIKYYSCIDSINLDTYKLYFINDNIYDNENDNSSVIYTNIDNNKFLFMADASKSVESVLLSKYNLKNISVLKVGHHGSKTSSSKDFINYVDPKYSVISVGKNNRYGHPNKEVLDVLNNTKVYRTDIDGSITFKINKELKVKVYTP